MRARRNSMVSALPRYCLVLGKLSLSAAWRVKWATSAGFGIGKLRRPAFESCQTYSLWERHASVEASADDTLSRQPFGFGPAIDLPFTTYRARPFCPSAVALGYHPVGT